MALALPHRPYPYKPENCEILYAPESNYFLQEAKREALEKSEDPKQLVGVVIVSGDKILARGANAGGQGGGPHDCERLKRGCQSGQGYEFCVKCQPQSHAEQLTVRRLKEAFVDRPLPTDLVAYMWGHWWACQGCWEKLQSVGIRTLYLSEEAEKFDMSLKK